jgi:hypothetical protein
LKQIDADETGDNNIEITPEMIDAAVSVLRSWISEEARSGEFDREIVCEIFEAMKNAIEPSRS